MERMRKNLDPLFTDITWGAGGSTADLSLQLALNLQKTGHVGKSCLSIESVALCLFKKCANLITHQQYVLVQPTCT